MNAASPKSAQHTVANTGMRGLGVSMPRLYAMAEHIQNEIPARGTHRSLFRVWILTLNLCSGGL
jgi:hypothetical protein